MDPCGTSNSRYLGEDIVSPVITLWERLCRYDENHCRAVPEKPKYDHLSLSKRRVWLSVSNSTKRSLYLKDTEIFPELLF